MPAKKQKYSEVKNIRWITVRGRRIPVKPGQDKLSQIKENMKDFKPEGGGKDPAKAKNYEKSVFRPEVNHKIIINDMVVFDDYTKAGQVIGGDGVNVVISSPGAPAGLVRRNPDSVFKISELIGGDYHWDNISNSTRRTILAKAGVPSMYVQKSWGYIPAVIQDRIQKGYGPAGQDIEAETAGIWNPVSGDEPLYKRLEDSAEEKEMDKEMEEEEKNGEKKSGKFGGDKKDSGDKKDDKMKDDKNGKGV